MILEISNGQQVAVTLTIACDDTTDTFVFNTFPEIDFDSIDGVVQIEDQTGEFFDSLGIKRLDIPSRIIPEVSKYVLNHAELVKEVFD